MARIRMVTRTVTVTTVEALTLDVTTRVAENKKFELSGITYNYENALKAVKKEYETETLKIVSVVELTEREECYGMLESEFLKSAKRLDNETRKLIEE